MHRDGTLRDTPQGTIFQTTDGNWSIEAADMAHALWISWMRSLQGIRIELL